MSDLPALVITGLVIAAIHADLERVSEAQNAIFVDVTSAEVRPS